MSAGRYMTDGANKRVFMIELFIPIRIVRRIIMSKAIFPKELLSDVVEEYNQKWIDEYKSETEYEKPYYDSLEQFFKFIRFKELSFNKFRLKHVEEYIEVMIEQEFSTKRIDYMISNISSLRTFLLKKYPDLFPIEFLSGLTDLKLGSVDDRKNGVSEPLNLVQLSLVREWIKNKPRTEYIFEIFYQLGIQKKDFEMCTLKYVDKENSCFRKNNNVIKYNKKIAELISKVESNSKFKATFHMITDHIKKIEKFLKDKGVYDINKSLTLYDITKTHERYFVVCPNCGEKCESISENWVLAKTDFCVDMFLVCSNCKGEPNHGINRISSNK